MTLISALISIRGTAVSTDSLLTIRNKATPDSFDQVEWNLSKLVRLEKFCGTISFWGDAVAEPKYPIPKDKKKTEFKWTLYHWLTEKCKNISENSLEDFVRRLTQELKAEYAKRQWLKYGIGLHVTGYELIEGTYIPELFLISNYANTGYVELRDLSYSRETFHTITETPPEERHRDSECRKVVHQYLINGGLIIYNNGDPNLFNPVFKAIFDTYLHSRQLDKVKEIETLQNLISLIRRPIEIVAKFQSDFFKEDKMLIGGQVHDLAVWRDQSYYSTSGD
jgi:hypothetical protein